MGMSVTVEAFERLPGIATVMEERNNNVAMFIYTQVSSHTMLHLLI